MAETKVSPGQTSPNGQSTPIELPPIAQVLERHRGERHAVILQDYPDPDAIASGWAHRLIAQRYDIECAILYSGRISHQENLALVRLLEIQLQRYNDEVELDQFDGAVFVDNQGTTTLLLEPLRAAGVPPLIIVDHHESQDVIEPEFADIRRIGATATIYVGYVRDGMLQLSPERREHVRLATALMHGILTETGGFVRAHPEDFQAAAYLSRFHDPALLEKVMSQARSHAVMEVIQRALQDREIRRNFSISGIGYLRAEDRDAIPQAADFLLTEENVHTAIVYGLVVGDDGEETIAGSLRTVKVTIDPDELLKSTFGRGSRGQYFGGGKREAGGFEIPVGFLSGSRNDDYRRLKWQVFNEQIKQRLYDRLGLTEEDEE
ncbi:MAG: bifunctional oligoribonuclease/PAP phosphatase NrnA [Ardenticatenaceae bacterium]|nr:bifunctional oligoribonuclease/PAP phosphatase NrnA [Ardenticatenaceae bacterium]HBY92468.1 exopolyphosphatase-like protein [Chloroflexota bacterium]